MGLPRAATIRGVVGYQHGTTTGRAGAPSAPTLREGVLAAALFAGAGYALVAPDHLGLGASTTSTPTSSPRPPPRPRSTSCARRATSPPTATSPGAPRSTSPGSPRAVTPRRSPSAPSNASPTRPCRRSPRRPSPGRTTWRRSRSRRRWPGAPGAIRSTSPTSARYDQGRGHWFVDALRVNEALDWAPRAPIRLYYGDADLDVDPSDSRNAARRMTAVGGNATAVSVGPHDHGGSVLHALPLVRDWFDRLSAPP